MLTNRMTLKTATRLTQILLKSKSLQANLLPEMMGNIATPGGLKSQAAHRQCLAHNKRVVPANPGSTTALKHQDRAHVSNLLTQLAQRGQTRCPAPRRALFQHGLVLPFQPLTFTFRTSLAWNSGVQLWWMNPIPPVSWGHKGGRESLPTLPGAAPAPGPAPLELRGPRGSASCAASPLRAAQGTRPRGRTHRHGDGHAGLGDSVHGRRHQRGFQRDPLGQRRGQVLPGRRHRVSGGTGAIPGPRPAPPPRPLTTWSAVKSMYPGRMRKSLRGNEGTRVSHRSGPAAPAARSQPHSLVGEAIAAAEELLCRQPVVGHVAGAAADQIIRHGPAACPPRRTERTRAPTAAGRAPPRPPRHQRGQSGPGRGGGGSAPWRRGGARSGARPRLSPRGTGDSPGPAVAPSRRHGRLSSFSAPSPRVQPADIGSRRLFCAQAEQPGPCPGRRQQRELNSSTALRAGAGLGWHQHRVTPAGRPPVIYAQVRVTW